MAQIIDYASYLDAMDPAELAEYISERSGEHGIAKIEDFQDWYNSRDLGELESLKPLRLFLVGLGADDRTERMVRFLANNSGMDISLLTFHGFKYDGKILLARQVEVEAAAAPGSRRARRYVSTAERRERLKRRIEESGVSELFDAVRDMFRENWPRSGTSPGVYGLSIQLQRRSYARSGVWKGGVGVVFFPRAKTLCLDEFRQPVKEVRYQTWPKNREPLEDADTEIHFILTAGEWKTHKEKLTALTQVVYEAWKSRDQQEEDSA